MGYRLPFFARDLWLRRPRFDCEGSSQSVTIVVSPRCSSDVNGVPGGVAQLTNIPSRHQGISLGLQERGFALNHLRKLKVDPHWHSICSLKKGILKSKEKNMVNKTTSTDTVYKLVEVIGTSTQSWEDAAKNAVETASRTLRDLRIAEVVELDVKVENGKVRAFRARMRLSFKYGS
jgi:dodecin